MTLLHEHDFIAAASVPRVGAHEAGTLDEAEGLRRAQPDIAASSIHAAAVLGDADGIARFLATDPALAVAEGGPYGWTPLTYLCFSRYLRLRRDRAADFRRSASLLLGAGAPANSGWHDKDPGGQPVWESALYGAAALARDAELTRLLLEHGADPNDDETPYHVPESRDLGAAVALIESGRLSGDSLAMMLLRKTDVHDQAGVALMLEAGADPRQITRWGLTALHSAVRRDNAESIVALLLDHGADPAQGNAHGESAAALAARRGRGDLLRLFQSRGMSVPLTGVDALLAQCAIGDRVAALAAVESQRSALTAHGGAVLAAFAGNDNVEGVRLLLELGVPVDALFVGGDGYFGVAPRSTALHVAAWRGAHGAVAALLHGGAAVQARDGAGRTPLALAVRACVDSYWMERRSPASVAALLQAGATAREVSLPTGYDALDDLLRAAPT